MNALDSLERISNTKLFIDNQLRYCLVDENKLPYKIDGSRAASNDVNSFVSFSSLIKSDQLERFKGLGISVQFSNVCGIDVDHCFKKELDFSSGDERAQFIYNNFKDFAYIEFSFSGKGMRVLFRTDSIEDYKEKYYIKNSNVQIEYYQPKYGFDPISYRYLTITGNTISNNSIINPIKNVDKTVLISFLDKYMKRSENKVKPHLTSVNDNQLNEKEIKRKLRYYLLKDFKFQNNWFMNAPGSGSNESERDYWLVESLYSYITTDENIILELFESSPFYKSKDYKHQLKWNRNNKAYFKYMIGKIKKEYGTK